MPIRYIEIWHDKGKDEEYPITALSISGSYIFNKTTSVIWRFLDGETSINEIINKLSKLTAVQDKK